MAIVVHTEVIYLYMR